MPLLPRRRTGESRWEEDNRLEANPAAYVAVGGLVALLAGLALLIWLL